MTFLVVLTQQSCIPCRLHQRWQGYFIILQLTARNPKSSPAFRILTTAQGSTTRCLPAGRQWTRWRKSIILSVRMHSVREILLTLRLSESKRSWLILLNMSKEKPCRGLTLWIGMGECLFYCLLLLTSFQQ